MRHRGNHMPSEPHSIAEITAAARKAIAEGDAILDRAHHIFGIERRHNDGDGPLMRAWKCGEIPVRRAARTEAPSTDQPSLPEMIRMIAESDRRGRPIVTALGLVKLRERYETLDPDELPEDERDWPAFARKRLPLPVDRINRLIGAMVHRGDILRCSACGSETASPCGCGAAYVSTRPWVVTAAPANAA